MSNKKQCCHKINGDFNAVMTEQGNLLVGRTGKGNAT